MRFLIQRVKFASVTIDGQLKGKIEKGLLVLVGVGQMDNEAVADKMMQKLVNMRIFEDENGKTNLNLEQVGGELLVVSQFTLYADCRKGNRPSFIKSMEPTEANRLYEYIIESLKKMTNKVECGEFGADMKVELLNDGPFTIILDSEEL